MRAIRKSPVTRATAWALTVTLIMPILLMGRGIAKAQGQQVLRVIVADIVKKGKGGPDNLGISATAAVYNELLNTGQGRFAPFSNQEVLTEAKRIGLRVPSVAGQPANFGRTDLLRIAKEMQADAIVEGEVAASATKDGRTANVSLGITVLDVSSQEYINGAFSQLRSTPRPGEGSDTEELISRAVEDAALNVVRETVQKQLVSATVLQRNGEIVILNRGLRDGIHEGDDMVVSRETPSGRVKQAIIRVVRAYAQDSEAEVRQDLGGVRPEDTARVLYTRRFVISPEGDTRSRDNVNRQVNFSTIGRTIGVLGLGILIASAARGGNTSVTNVTAEATTDSGGAAVRISWGDNIFGQANVLQYKIFRNPDFPYSPSLVNVGGSTGNGGGGGTGGGTVTFIPIIPVGTTVTRNFIDHASPYFPYRNGANILSGTPANGSLFTGNGNSGGSGGTGGGTGGGGGTSTGCGTLAIGILTDTGFTIGRSYTYDVTAVIIRQLTVAGSSTSGGTGGTGGGVGSGTSGGGTGGTGGGTSGGSTIQCIESDPVRSGLATPLSVPALSYPVQNSTNVSLTQFRPQFLGQAGADIYQVEVSTDRTFSNPNTIYRLQILSSNPNQAGAQTSPDNIDLTQSPELLSNATFANYVTNGGNPPTLYYRIGARHDEDSPGPVHWITRSGGDPDRTFRFVYSPAVQFQPATVPPPPPGGGKAAAQLNKLRTVVNRSGNALPQPGDTQRGRAVRKSSIPSIQDILIGRGRGRN